jgi:GNAT superfamily N-acetyltransferase
MLTIAPATSGDAASLASLSAQLGYPLSAAEMRAALALALADPDQAVFVAKTAAGDAIGWVHGFVRPLLMVEKHIEVGALVVDAAQRGQGAGRLLMAAIEGWAKEKGCSAIYLRSGEQRVDAHRFYEAIGYERLKVSQTF